MADNEEDGGAAGEDEDEEDDEARDRHPDKQQDNLGQMMTNKTASNVLKGNGPLVKRFRVFFSQLLALTSHMLRFSNR